MSTSPCFRHAPVRSASEDQCRRRLTLGIAVLGGVWVGGAAVLGPYLADVAERAVRGESLPLLNQPLARVSPESLTRYRTALTGLGVASLLPWVVAVAATWVLTSPRFFTRYVREATPESLGAIRIVVCGVLLAMTLLEDLGATAMLPREMVRPYGVLKLFYLLPGFATFVQDATALRVFQGLTAGLLLLGALGYRTRVVIPAAGVCDLLLGGIIRQYAFYFHTGIVPLYVLLVLAFTPCGDGWSLDRLLKARRGRVFLPQAAVYGWARYACWVAIALPYLAAGLSKLRNGGPLWWVATNMRSILYTCTLQPLNFAWEISLSLHPAPDVLFAALGLAVLITELTFAAVLFSRKARLLCAANMMVCQTGIIFLQNILFLDLLVLAAFFADDRTCHRLGSWCAASRARLGHGTGARLHTAPPAPPWPDRTFASAPTLRPTVAVAGLILLLSTCWLWRIERYPLTAMQMFSAVNRSGVIDYYKVFAHYPSGAVARISLTEVLGSEADFRYRYHLREAFDPQTAHVATRYLTAGGAALNRRAQPAHQVTHLEVQHWQWNFRAQPQSATYGQLVDQFTVLLEPPDASPRTRRGPSRDRASVE